MKETFEEVYEAWSSFFSGIGEAVAAFFIFVTSPFWIIPYAIYKKMEERRKQKHHVRKKEY